MSSRISAVLVLMLLALVPGDASAQYQRNWDPNRYRVHCDDDQCFDAGVRYRIERMLTTIGSIYKQQGWRLTDYFGPVKGSGADRHVRVINKGDRLAGIVGSCKARTFNMQFGSQIPALLASKPHVVYSMVAHELFHLVHRRYPAFSQCLEQKAGWIMESTASAIGWDLARKKYPSRFPANDEVTAIKAVGVRRYDVPLNHVVYEKNGEEKESGVHAYYHSNSFWRHLAEVYHGGSYRYLDKYFRNPPSNWDWIEWLHHAVLLDAKIGFALGPVYATFVTDYATWHEQGKPAQRYSKSEWLNKTFGGCKTIQLSPTASSASIAMDLQRIAAKCVRVQVHGIGTHHRTAVNAAAFTSGGQTNLVDQLHLGLAASSDSVRFRCSDEIRKSNPRDRVMGLHRCLFVANTGTVKIGGTSQPARVWDVIPQTIARGAGFENIYLVSRVAPNPTSDGHQDDGGKRMKFTMAFVLDTAEAQLNGQPMASAGQKKVVAHLNSTGPSNAQEQVPKHNAQGGIAKPLVYPHAPRGVKLPPVPLDLIATQGRKGIWMIRLTQTNIRPDGLYQDHIKSFGLETINVLPANDDGAQPLQVGDKGPVSVMVTGAIAGRPIGSKEPGRLIVDEFTDKVLRARLTAVVCDFGPGNSDSDCPNPRTLTANVVKAFAALHQPLARYQVEDSPSIAEYRQRLDKLMSMAMARPASGGGGGGSGGGSGGAAAAGAVDPKTVPDPLTGPNDSTVVVKGSCNCTCNDPYALQVLRNQLESGEKIESPAVWKRIRMHMACMQPCAPVYMQCANKGAKMKP